MLRTTRVDLALLSAIVLGTSACTEQAASEAERTTLLISNVHILDGTGAVITHPAD